MTPHDPQSPAELARYQPVAGGRDALLARLAATGTRGDRGGVHRGIVTQRTTPIRVAWNVGLVLLLGGGLVALVPSILRLWHAVFEIGVAALQIPGSVATRAWTVGPITMDVPVITAQAGAPDAGDWILVGTLSVIALGGSFLLPVRFLPLTLLLRFGFLAQAAGFLVFWLAPDVFDYALPSYVVGFLQSGAGFVVLVPLALGLIYYPFDVGTTAKVALTACIAGHLVLLVPLHALTHAYLLHHLSLLVLPTLVFTFGVVLEVISFVALYGWGMSWRTLRRGDGSGE